MKYYRESKEEAVKRLYCGITVDYALPYGWICNVEDKLNINPRDVNIGGMFVWGYPKGNMLGEPLPVCEEGQRILSDYRGLTL
jgi:hypothetical protein